MIISVNSMVMIFHPDLHWCGQTFGYLTKNEYSPQKIIKVYFLGLAKHNKFYTKLHSSQTRHACIKRIEPLACVTRRWCFYTCVSRRTSHFIFRRVFLAANILASKLFLKIPRAHIRSYTFFFFFFFSRISPFYLRPELCASFFLLPSDAHTRTVSFLPNSLSF